MKILVAGIYGGSNGIETYTGHLVDGLAAAGHDVLLCARVEPAPPAFGNGNGGLSRRDLPGRSWRLRRLIGPFESLVVWHPLREIARSFRPDVVHATYPEFALPVDRPLVVTAWHPQIRVAARVRSAGTRHARRREELLFGLSDTVAFRHASAIAAVSREVARSLRQAGREAVWLPPFVPDSAVLAPAQQRSQVCVMIARWLDHPRKGLSLAVRAVEQARRTLPQLRLVLLGGWLDRRRQESLPDFCEARGQVSAEGVSESLRNAACCLVPSLWEEFGYVGLEGLAAGAPVVCGPLPGYEGLETAGLVRVAERTPGAFAEGIVRAAGLREFAFPPECRASNAMARFGRLYQRLAEVSDGR